MTIPELLESKRICICAGAGGVGKTTTSAAIAMGMASRGLRVAVLTIDPAKRLATSLGMEELGNEARQVAPERFAAQGLEMRGELWAMMLDAKRTWDELIERNAPDEATRDRVLSNRIYQELSNALAGSTEYMAMEKLYELHHDGDYDLLVLDTPPSRNALDFLDAPQRLARFVDSRSLQFFLKPGRMGLRVFGRGGGLLFSMLKRLTGVDLLQDLSEFFQSFGDMAAGFGERAEQVGALLAAPETTFLVVTSPQRDAIDEGIFFLRRLRESKLPFGAAIVNRVHDGAVAPTPQLGSELEDLLGDRLARKVVRNFDDHRRLAQSDRHGVEELAHELGGEPLITVPLMDDDVYDLAGLDAINEYLFEAPAIAAGAPAK
ncbi:MAG: ArsA family ATPase [Thermoleophilaceae bacterium]